MVEISFFTNTIQMTVVVSIAESQISIQGIAKYGLYPVLYGILKKLFVCVSVCQCV